MNRKSKLELPLRVCMCVCVVHVFQPLVEFREAHVGAQLLEKDLDKDPAGGRRGLLAHLDALQHLVDTHTHTESVRLPLV